MTIVSFSEVVKWQTCQREYYYNYELNLRPNEESMAITTGVKGHKLLQNFYEYMGAGESKEQALKLVTQNANNLIRGEPFTSQLALSTAWTLVSNYIEETEFTAEAILIENRFLLPASLLSADPVLDDVQIGFTPDVVFRRKGDMIDVEDAKFVGRAWSQKKLNRFPQLKLYQIFLEHMNYEISRTLLRFFNVTTGKITTKPYITTKEEKKILIRDFLSGIKEVLTYREQTPFSKSLAPRTMNCNACQFCYFEEPCTLEAEGKNASNTLRYQYKESSYDYRS